MVKKHSHNIFQWKILDLHLHTKASGDYQQPEVSYLDILQRAEARGLDIIAFTDHNTVAGYREMQEEIDQLELLEKLNRLFSISKKLNLIRENNINYELTMSGSLWIHLLQNFFSLRYINNVWSVAMSEPYPSEIYL